MQMAPVTSDERDIRFSSAEAGAGSPNYAGSKGNLVDNVKKHTGFDKHRSQHGISSSSSSDDNRERREKFYDQIRKDSSSSSSTSYQSIESEGQRGLSLGGRFRSLSPSSVDSEKTPIGSPIRTDSPVRGRQRRHFTRDDEFDTYT